MTVSAEQQQTTARAKVLRVARGLAVIVIASLVIAWVLNLAAAALEKRNEPAGFIHGIVQGALMPIAMPNLAAGNDVPIYAANNTGRLYKLGYTVGVNLCGLTFFGVFFWRLRKLKGTKA